MDTVKILNIGTPKIITIIVLQLEQLGFYIAVMCSKEADRITNREDPDQTALHCLLRPICPII